MSHTLHISYFGPKLSVADFVKVEQLLADHSLPSRRRLVAAERWLLSGSCRAVAAGASVQGGPAEAHGPLARSPSLAVAGWG